MKLLQLLPFVTLVAAQTSVGTFSETPKEEVSFGISIPKGGGKGFIGRIVCQRQSRHVDRSLTADAS